MGKSEHCPNCGLQYRIWIQKLEQQVCDECNPKEFKELHKKNVRQHKKRFIGQEHITEHTFFPTEKKPTNYRDARGEYRRQQK